MTESYTCPMHPDVQLNQPGMCPACGMRLISQAVNSQRSKVKSGHNSHVEGHDRHAGHQTADFLVKFWVSLLLTIPVVVYSELPERLLGITAPSFWGSSYLGLIFGSIVFFYGGSVFLVSAVRELRARLPGMMTLIALAITAAYLYSVGVTVFNPGEHTLFWELTTLITIMLLGHYLEMRAVQGTQGALRELSKLLPDTAELVVNPKSDLKSRSSKLTTKTVKLTELKVGDLVLVRPGGRIPADGVVVDGESDVDEALVTGESRPVSKGVGSVVIAGTINGDGTLTIKVTKIGDDTFLSGVMRLVAEAQASKSRLQLLSDQAALALTVIAVGVGLVTFGYWVVNEGVAAGIERAVAVLVVACPHALGLAIPLVASISTTLAARNGFLVRQRLALEAARAVDVVLFDKTGTLTTGHFGVTEVIATAKAKNEDEVLRLAAAVDQKSEHFIARAIVAAADERGLKLPDVKGFQRLSGRGVSGVVAGVKVVVGGEAVLSDDKLLIPEKIREASARLGREGKTVIYVIADGQLLGLIGCSDVIRQESREAVYRLNQLGVKVAMVTGDSEPVAAYVARELGIKQVFARVLPDQKADKVKFFQKQGQRVAFVGDGINDAPALVQADVGIAIGAGTNVAIESAGIILVRDDPRDIPKVIVLSRATYAKMVQNLFWATGYNVVAIPLAAGVLANQGVVLQPAVSALLMSVSTIIVAFNAILLRRIRL